jgi:hypothetical protein
MAGGSGEHLLAERRVSDPSGREWRIGIRWLPRRPTWVGLGFRRRRRHSPRTSKNRFWWADLLDIGDVPAAIAVVVVLLAALVFAWFVLVPILVLLLDVLLVAILVTGAVSVRVLFRRPWTVRATTDDSNLQWGVAGYRAARRSVHETADLVQRGLVPDSTTTSRLR